MATFNLRHVTFQPSVFTLPIGEVAGGVLPANSGIRLHGKQAKRSRTSNRPTTGHCQLRTRRPLGQSARPRRKNNSFVAGEDWSKSARKFVGHSLNFKMPYMQDRWLFNVRTSSRSEVGPAEVLIGAGQPSEVHNGWQPDGSYSQGTCQAA